MQSFWSNTDLGKTHKGKTYLEEGFIFANLGEMLQY